MRKLLSILVLLLAVGCTKKEDSATAQAPQSMPEAMKSGGALTLYCGREKELVEGILAKFT
jgi:hypothetical protein